MSLTNANAVDSLQGHFKEVYADKIKDLRPEGSKLLTAIDFISSDKMAGAFYHQPVMLSHEHGKPN